MADAAPEPEDAPEPNIGGRPPFEPTEEMRGKVESLVGFGYKQDDICKLIMNPQTGEPISRVTLEKYFRREIDIGALKANALVCESMHGQATGRAKVVRVLEDGTQETVREGVKPNTTMGIWWSKARMGWSETKYIAGKDGGPIQFEEKSDARERVARNIRRLTTLLEAQEDDGSPGGDGS